MEHLRTLHHLHDACAEGNLPEVQKILAQDSSIIDELTYNTKSHGEQAAIHLAVEGEHAEICKLLLTKGANPNILNNDGYAPIHIACGMGNLEIVQLFIDMYTAAIDLVKDINSTTIHEAVCSNSLEIVKLVTEKVGDRKANLINHQDNKKWSPLHYACQYGYDKIVNFLILEGAKVDLREETGRTCLHLAAFEGHTECAKILLQQENCSVDVQDNEGWTAVILASQENHPDIVKLICSQADLSLCSELYKRNAMHAASFHGNKECVKYLLETSEGHKLVGSKDKDGWTPFHLAAQEGHADVIKCFLSNPRIDVEIINSQANNKCTPIHTAAWKGEFQMVKLLLDHHADTTLKDSKGWTPLHVASQNGFSNIVDLLVSEHPNCVNDVLPSGRSCLHLSAFEGHSDVVRCLIKYSINCNLKDTEGWSPLYLAVQQAHTDIVQTLLEVPNINILNRAKNGRIPLHSACSFGHVEIMKLLLAGHIKDKQTDCMVKDNEGFTPLHLCSQKGHIEIVKELVRNQSLHVDVNTQSLNGKTALHLASLEGKKEVVDFLIKNGANINKQDHREWSPLYTACLSSNNKDVVSLLLKKSHINVRGKTEEGRTALHLAARNGFLEICHLLIEKLKDKDVDAEDVYGWTPLHLAAWERHLDVVKVLVEKKANVHATTKNGRTPLHMCSYSGGINIIKYLISKGANVHSRDNKQLTPFHVACKKGHLKSGKLLKENGAEINAKMDIGRNALHICAFHDQKEMAKYLLDENIDIDVPDREGWTPLHVAAQRGHIGLIQLLLAKGADPTARSNYLRIPLHLAAMFDHPDIVKLLVKHVNAPNIDVTDSNQWTPLHSACNNCHSTTVRTLINLGADCHRIINTKRNCLHLSAFKGGKEVCEILLHNGCEMQAQDKDGWTPLHLAAQEGHIQTVSLLLNHKTLAGDQQHTSQDKQLQRLVDARSNNDCTPLQLACVKGQTEVVSLLISKGAQCGVFDKNGFTALMDAASTGAVELVALLVDNGVDMNVQTHTSQETALHLSLSKHYPKVASYLIQKEANLSLPDNNGKTAFHVAVENGYLQIIRSMYERAPDLLHKTTIANETPLEIASQNGDINIVEYLLKQGTHNEDEKRNASEAAISNGCYDIASLIKKEIF